MARNFNSFATTLPTTEGDICTASSKSMTLLIQAVNVTDTPATCELWMTDDTDTHYACLFPSQSVSAYNGVSDTAKHIIPSGYKIRGVSDLADTIFIEVSLVEGM